MQDFPHDCGMVDTYGMLHSIMLNKIRANNDGRANSRSAASRLNNVLALDNTELVGITAVDPMCKVAVANASTTHESANSIIVISQEVQCL